MLQQSCAQMVHAAAIMTRLRGGPIRPCMGTVMQRPACSMPAMSATRAQPLLLLLTEPALLANHTYPPCVQVGG